VLTLHQDLEQALFITHTIKGVVGNLGAMRLQEHARQMKIVVKENKLQQLEALMPVNLKKHHHSLVCNVYLKS